MRVLLVVVVMLVAAGPAPAQPSWPQVPQDLELDLGLGYTLMAWEWDYRDDGLVRGSYLPGLSATLTVPFLLSRDSLGNTIVLSPHAGLAFDGVRYRSLDDYQDHYAVTSLTGSLLLSAHARWLNFAFGPELRWPIWVRASLYSRTPAGDRAWVRFADPALLRDSGSYWTFRLGGRRTTIGITFNSARATIFGLLPENDLDYLRFHLHRRLRL